MKPVFAQVPTSNRSVMDWVAAMTDLCKPDEVFWCDGSEAERTRLTEKAIALGEVEALDPNKRPGCLYARSAENDVARVEQLTFICTRRRRDAGPTNNWMDPQEAYGKLRKIFDGSMKGRTLYVVPFVMGIPGSPFAKIGFELTDSIYVVLNMRIMTRMGRVALDALGDSEQFTKGLHSKAHLDEHERFICHFPEDNAIWSVGSNYGGNVLLGKKCLALRIASWLGRTEGWLAEHMMIMGVEDPSGRIRYVAAAFPSQCGKTNLAMLVPPASMPGWRIWTVGDDIAWLRVDKDGRLRAANPEAGFFGVAPGTNMKSNPNAVKTVARNTIFTNVVKTHDGDVWWEGLENPPSGGTDWTGHEWSPASGRKGAHPNSRFTAPAAQCPCISPEWENPEGVPISAIIFGGRRERVAPLVFESTAWTHGVYLGATMASETTAAATGQVGVVRRDPMAMLPFCGYDIGDYFRHWLDIGKRLTIPPKIFHVNWYRKDAGGNFIWPGFGDNLRVLKWIIERTEGEASAQVSPIGYMPRAEDLMLEGSGVSAKMFEDELVSLDMSAWMIEAQGQRDHLQQLGRTVPEELLVENRRLMNRLCWIDQEKRAALRGAHS